MNTEAYMKKHKGPPHQKSAIVDLFLNFVGGATKEYDYGFWLKQVGSCTYGDAIDIIKSLNTLPVQYNKGGTIVNKLKKLNGERKRS